MLQTNDGGICYRTECVSNRSMATSLKKELESAQEKLSGSETRLWIAEQKLLEPCLSCEMEKSKVAALEQEINALRSSITLLERRSSITQPIIDLSNIDSHRFFGFNGNALVYVPTRLQGTGAIRPSCFLLARPCFYDASNSCNIRKSKIERRLWTRIHYVGSKRGVIGGDFPMQCRPRLKRLQHMARSVLKTVEIAHQFSWSVVDLGLKSSARSRKIPLPPLYCRLQWNRNATSATAITATPNFQ